LVGVKGVVVVAVVMPWCVDGGSGCSRVVMVVVVVGGGVRMCEGSTSERK
jgi:hypothetical protein